MINLHGRMLPTSAGVEPATSWSPVGWHIQLSHWGRHLLPGINPAGWVANSVDSDHMTHPVLSDLRQQFSLACVCPNIWVNISACTFNYDLLTVVDLKIAHTPKSAQSSNFRDLRLQPFYFYPLLYKIIRCGYSLRQFKWVPTTYDFIKEIRKHITQAS